MKKLSFVLGFLPFFNGSVMTVVADRLTPVEETVCNEAELSSAARNLCNDYCEAMSCDSDMPKVALHVCLETAQKYAEKTSGSLLPCERIEESSQDNDGVPDAPDNFSEYFDVVPIELVKK
jgi:hypothetical protein